MLLVMLTCQTPVFMLNGVRLVATATVAVNSVKTKTILLYMCVPSLPTI
jgi:hypothetical protein